MSTPKSQRTRRAILQAARRLIEQTGHEEWTMEGVADHANVTRMTVYRYFPSRVELIIETARHVDEVEGAARRFEGARHASSGVDALEQWAHAWAEYIPHIAPVAKALMSARARDEAAAKAWEDRTSALRNGPLHICQQLADDGTLAEDLTVDTAADLMWAIASIQVWDALTGDRGWSTAKYQGQLSQTLRRVLTDRR